MEAQQNWARVSPRPELSASRTVLAKRSTATARCSPATTPSSRPWSPTSSRATGLPAHQHGSRHPGSPPRLTHSTRRTTEGNRATSLTRGHPSAGKKQPSCPATASAPPCHPRSEGAPPGRQPAAPMATGATRSGDGEIDGLRAPPVTQRSASTLPRPTLLSRTHALHRENLDGAPPPTELVAVAAPSRPSSLRPRPPPTARAHEEILLRSHLHSATHQRLRHGQEQRRTAPRELRVLARLPHPAPQPPGEEEEGPPTAVAAGRAFPAMHSAERGRRGGEEVGDGGG